MQSMQHHGQMVQCNAGSTHHGRIVHLARQQACSIARQQQQQQGPDISCLHPLLQRQWDHAKNCYLGSIVIKPYSGKKVWWKCAECPDGHQHEWAAMVTTRSVRAKHTCGNGCPFCAGMDVCSHNSLAVNDPAVAAEWSDSNPDKPEHYTVSSHAKTLWRCDSCGSEWSASIISRTNQHSGCPHCFHQKQKNRRQQQPPVM